MTMVLQIGPEHIPCEVVQTTGKRIRMGFKPGAPVLMIHTPSGKLTRQASTFVQQQEQWILKQYARQKALFSRRQRFLEDLDQGKIVLEGVSTRIRYVPHPEGRIIRQADSIDLFLPEAQIPDAAARRHYLKAGLRSIAKEALPPRTHELAHQTHSTINSIRIKDHKSKWGSCSAKRNINLNWHLLLLSKPLIDYVIIHELMHLREMNHSARFWKWVETYYPDYRQAEKQIKTQEWLIGILDA